MQSFNYHTHTYRCGHADMSMSDEDYVKEFIKKGFKKIAFTDHVPHEKIIDHRTDMRMKYFQKEEYLNSIESLKRKYSNLIQIENGFEVEYLPGEEQTLYQLQKEVDKILLGQHYIYDEDNKNLKIFRHSDFTDMDLIKYAIYIEKALENKIGDIVVHPDLYMLTRDSFGEVEAKVAHIICRAAEKYDVPLEINLNEPNLCLTGQKDKVDYPSKGFWQIASKYKIKVLYGIDAHFKEQIRNYEESIEFANHIIGEDIIKNLNFIEEIDKKKSR